MTSRNTPGKFSLSSSMILTQTKTDRSCVYYLNPIAPVGASDFWLQKFSKVTIAMMTDVRFPFRRRQKKQRRDRISRMSPGPEMNPPVRLGPFTGRQNPTCGTAWKLHELSSRTNMHGLSHLRRARGFGTAVAKDLDVVESTSRPHCIQISLSIS
jgi:hypothetical protein